MGKETPDWEQVREYTERHMRAWERWPHGDIKEAWVEEGITCIRYQDGTWYHYREVGNELEWW